MVREMLGEIGYGFDRLADFPKEWNNGVYFRLRKIRQTVKDEAKARQTLALFGLETP